MTKVHIGMRVHWRYLTTTRGFMLLVLAAAVILCVLTWAGRREAARSAAVAVINRTGGHVQYGHWWAHYQPTRADIGIFHGASWFRSVGGLDPTLEVVRVAWDANPYGTRRSLTITAQ